MNAKTTAAYRNWTLAIVAEPWVAALAGDTA